MSVSLLFLQVSRLFSIFLLLHILYLLKACCRLIGFAKWEIWRGFVEEYQDQDAEQITIVHLFKCIIYILYEIIISIKRE